MQESITVLQSAKAAVADVTKFTLENPAYAKEKAKLDELYSTKIKKCFTDFEVSFPPRPVSLFCSLVFADRGSIQHMG
jgi:hypothetical protein